MSEWHVQCISALRDLAIDSKFWDDYLQPLRTTDEVPFGIHLGIFVEPFLTFILEGRKTVESRFSVVRCAPYDRVSSGDVLLLKRPAGPIVGLCRISSASFYELDSTNWLYIRKQFAKAICADDDFWESRCHSAYASLMTVTDPIEVSPFHVMKKDRRGWVVVAEAAPFPQLGLLV